MEGPGENERTKHLKTVYIGSLHEETTEALLCTLFGQFGNIQSCKLLKDAGSACKFAFIEYDEHNSAYMAMQAMAGRVFLGRTIKVNWATPSAPERSTGLAAAIGPGFASANHHAIFVGDISSEISDEELYEAFSKYGVISDCRIIRDPVTLKCRNYGFITFVSQESAANAIKDMNGYWIGNRSIRTNWARRRNGLSLSPSSFVETDGASSPPPPVDPARPTYQEIDSQASFTNKTIYCGNFTSGLTQHNLGEIFYRFGEIVNIRVFRDKGYGFVQFAERSSAVRAILEMNETIIDGRSIRVSWGREEYPTAADISYWQSCQHFQYAFSMYAQQHHFYQANVAVQAMQNYYSQYVNNGAQSQVQGNSFGMNNPFQAAAGAGDQRMKMQSEASAYWASKNVGA